MAPSRCRKKLALSKGIVPRVLMRYGKLCFSLSLVQMAKWYVGKWEWVYKSLQLALALRFNA